MILFNNYFWAKLKLDFLVTLVLQWWAMACIWQSFQSVKTNSLVALLSQLPNEGQCQFHAATYFLSLFRQESRSPKNYGKLSLWLDPAILYMRLITTSYPFFEVQGPEWMWFPRSVKLKSMWCHRIYLRITGSKGFHIATFPYSTLISQPDVCLLGVFGYTRCIPGTFLETEWNPGQNNWNRNSPSLFHVPFERILA